MSYADLTRRPRVQPLPPERPRTLGAAIACLSLAAVIVLAAMLSGCSSVADAHLRLSTGAADGAVRTWPANSAATNERLMREAAIAFWVQRALRLGELPEDPAMRATVEQRKAAAERAAEEGE